MEVLEDRKCIFMKRNYLNVESVVRKGKVEEVTVERYDEMLGVLPPERMATNAFLVGEAYDHDGFGSPRFALFFENEGRYYEAGICTTADFDAALV